MSSTGTLSISFRHELVVILSLSCVLVLAICLVPVPALRIAIGAPYVLFFPGYALVAALFPGREHLDALERLGLSFGLSIAVMPLMGLVLNYTPWGITLESTLVSGTTFMVVCSAVAYYRRSRLPPEQRFAPRVEIDLAGWRASGLIDRSLTVMLGLSIVAAVGTFLFVLARPKIGERFTEFYILGPGGQADGYATEVSVGEPITLIVGAINREHEEVTYRMVKDVNGHHAEQIAEIRLAHDEKWEEPFTFTMEQPGEDQKVSFLLYREGQDEPYRSLHLWIDVVPADAQSASPTPSLSQP